MPDKKIKMVATDIDGTIFNWNVGGFTPEVKNCIKNLSASGVKVVLVTGECIGQRRFWQMNSVLTLR